MQVKLHYLGDPITFNGEHLYYFTSGIVLPAVQVAGSMAMLGEIQIPAIGMSGYFATDGAFSLPIISIYGKTRDVINGAIRLHGVQIDGEIGVSSRIDAGIALPLLTLSGGMQAEGDVRLCLLAISGAMQHEGRIDGGVTLHGVEVSGLMAVTTWMTGSIEILPLSVGGGVTATGAIVTGAVSLRPLTILGAMSGLESHDFGTETDRVLRHAPSRRRI